MTQLRYRDYVPADAEKLNALAIKAFEQYKTCYSDWNAFKSRLGQVAQLSEQAEYIITTQNEQVVGSVAYVPSHIEKAPHFPVDTPIIRMLVVDPDCRGKGIGKQLTLECIRRAIRDGNQSIALHTSPIMTIALPMYLRMGFIKINTAPDINGVPYAVYQKNNLAHCH